RVLIAGGQDRAAAHGQRHPFVRSLVHQRAASRGMTGLVSARLSFYPHQVEVVRRVLQDPVQRYLLADEVGLGKTIEAGAILRQFLLDQSAGEALVLTPPLLMDQWEEELRSRFYLVPGKRVRVRSCEDPADWPDCRFVLIDEAQHIAALA